MNTFKLFFVLFVFTGLVACQGDKNGGGSESGVDTSTPEGSLRGFIEAISKKDFKTAKEFAMPATQNVLTMIELDEAVAAKVKPIGIKELKCEQDEAGQEATCQLCCAGEANETKSIKVMKHKGKWLVKTTKEEMK
ncbi:MAG: hypothetical protein MK212_15360 [Saprospiraceae bacterium]|nr:hypothetical protein [Saprospiraceae bacterium]